MMKTTSELAALLAEDLTHYESVLRDGRKWQQRIEEAYPHEKRSPWRLIADAQSDFRTYVILLWLRYRSLRDELGRVAEREKQWQAEGNQLRGQVAQLKRRLRGQVLQGASMKHYAACWAAWVNGDEGAMRKAAQVIERKRAAWRAKISKTATKAKARRLKRSAETLRNRAPLMALPVNWFARMPVYHPDPRRWGYCHATRQDRKRVSKFLDDEGQHPEETHTQPGAGRPLPLYGFKTNLLVLDQWLGDWLLNSPADDARRLPKAERVCEAIWRTLCASARHEATGDQVEQLRRRLRAHWQKWRAKVKDAETREIIPLVERALIPGAKAWRQFGDKLLATSSKARRILPVPRPLPGVMPFAEVRDIAELLRW